MINIKKNIKWLVYLIVVAISALLVFMGIQDKEAGERVSGDEVSDILGEKAFADHLGGGDMGDGDGGGDDGDGGSAGDDGTGDDGL